VRISNLFGAARTYLKGAAMTQADHYRDQSERARRLAEAVKDPEASKKLIQMAEEFRLYAERLEEAHEDFRYRSKQHPALGFSF